jgi:hypothetical protein
MVGPQKKLPLFGAVVGSGIRDKHPGSATLIFVTDEYDVDEWWRKATPGSVLKHSKMVWYLCCHI